MEKQHDYNFQKLDKKSDDYWLQWYPIRSTKSDSTAKGLIELSDPKAKGFDLGASNLIPTMRRKSIGIPTPQRANMEKIKKGDFETRLHL